MPHSDLVCDFLNYLRHVRAYSPHTIAAYRHDLDKWQSYLQQQEAVLTQISMGLVRSYVASLKRSNQMAGQVPLSNRSINRRISTLKSFYKYLQKRNVPIEGAATVVGSCVPEQPRTSEHLIVNPWDSISLLPQAQRLPNYLSCEELQKLAKTCATAFPTPYWQKLSMALLEVGFSSGARVSELCALDLRQLFKPEGLSQTLSQGPSCEGNEYYISEKLAITGKGGRQRFIFLGQSSREALSIYIAERHKFLTRLAQKKVGIDWQALFCNSYGVRLQPRSVHRLLAQLGRAAKLERPLHPHLLRHSFATTLLNHGAGIRSVQELLGHSSLNSTQIYTHVGIQRLREVHRAAHPRAKSISESR